MADKKKENTDYRKAANSFSIVMVLFLSASFIFETIDSDSITDYSFSVVLMVAALAIVIGLIKTTIHHHKLAFNVPISIFAFYTFLLFFNNWAISHYFLVCFALCVLSCIYFNFARSVVFVIVQNVAIGLLILRDNPVSGIGVSLMATLINWAICLLGQITMLLITRSATVVLNKALEQQHSFSNLLATTENYIAMVDQRNKVVYASKTLSKMGDIEDPVLVQGRPLIDLFPGKTLKLYAGKMLKEKENYAEDWEFSLNGQKRYFKAASHGLPGDGGGTLINLYDMTHLAERDEIAAMKDSMKIGLFFMDRNYVIQDHYSQYLEEMLSEKDLFGKLFTDIIADSVSSSELKSIKDYFGMVTERTYDQDMLDDINPLNELHYVNARTGNRKVFQFSFGTVERGQGEVFLLVTVYDITAKVILQQKLAEEEAKRQEEMQSFFELVQVEPDVFSDFSEDMEYEFDNIDKILKNQDFSAHDVLVKVYQSVHAIKSNAVILGLNVFGNKVHNLESKIKKLREIEGDVPFAEMLNLTMEIEKIAREKDGFRDILDKLQSYGRSSGGKRQNVKVLTESLAKAASKASEDMEKRVRFVVDDIEPEAIDKGPRRVIKEILTQLVRNSVVHGIEKPDDRKAKGKKEIGFIRLSIKMTDDHENINIKLSDDGKGLDYKKISEKAISSKMIKKEDADNKDALIKAIFAPGFSTADIEGVHAGRGIGLNLVRDRVKEINGSIKLRSETDKGIVFFVSIPVPKKEAS